MRCVFPGTFNPPTVAHLAIADAAREQFGLTALDFAITNVPLGKEGLVRPTVDERATVLRHVCATRPGYDVVVTDQRLIADIATGYDAVVVGADKWAQIVDPLWYADISARDAALRRLPPIVIVTPRAGSAIDASLHPVHWLTIDPVHLHVSSTAARGGELHLMLAEAVASGLWGDTP